MLNEAGDEGRHSAHARRGALHSKGEDSVKVSVDVLSVQEVGHVESLVHGVVRIFVFRIRFRWSVWTRGLRSKPGGCIRDVP